METGSDWLAPLRAAYSAPWTVAESWRARHGAVVGVFGRLVPRELFAAAGLLPVRLSPRRLSARGELTGDALPPGLAAELAPGPARVLAALLAGELDWIDFLVIGRDSESYTKLFYVLRELVNSRDHPTIPPIAFCDVLRTPARTSARYNRIRARELLETAASWGGDPVSEESLREAARDAALTAAEMRRLNELRTALIPTISGHDMLIAAGASQVLPAAEMRSAVAFAPGTAPAAKALGHPGRRVYLTGSGQDDPWTYEVLEARGLSIVGEDHEWGEDGLDHPEPTDDPLDGIVDARHLSLAGAARAGLAERTRHTASRARACAADSVLQIVFDDDEASGWEAPHLRELLGDEIPLVTIELEHGRRDEETLAAAVTTLLGGNDV